MQEFVVGQTVMRERQGLLTGSFNIPPSFFPLPKTPLNQIKISATDSAHASEDMKEARTQRNKKHTDPAWSWIQIRALVCLMFCGIHSI